MIVRRVEDHMADAIDARCILIACQTAEQGRALGFVVGVARAMHRIMKPNRQLDFVGLLHTPNRQIKLLETGLDVPDAVIATMRLAIAVLKNLQDIVRTAGR
jgi:hypothetical protein